MSDRIHQCLTFLNGNLPETPHANELIFWIYVSNIKKLVNEIMMKIFYFLRYLTSHFFFRNNIYDASFIIQTNGFVNVFIAKIVYTEKIFSRLLGRKLPFFSLFHFNYLTKSEQRSVLKDIPI